jgi:shikimate 5-dehydrogenase
MSEMHMLKIVELTTKSEKARFDFLSSFLKSQGVDNQWESIPVTHETVVDILKDSMTKFDQIIIDMEFGEEIRRNLIDLSTKHYFSPASDCLFYDKHHWLPRSYLEETFIETLNKNSEPFDIQANALIIGCGPLARVAITSFQKVGYTKFSVCDKNKEAAEAFFKDFSKRNFNLEFKYVSQDELAYLPGASSLMVNTLSAEDSSDLLNDLFYFNYLNKYAVVLDLNMYPLESPLLTQARDLGIRYIESYKFYVLRDFAWLQAISGKKLEWNGFEEAWLNSIKSTPA